jgi:hypothetical protein
MKASLRPLVLVLLVFSSSAFAGFPIQSLILPANSSAVSVSVPVGKVLTVLSFTADGSSQAGGAPGIAAAEQNAGFAVSIVNVLRSYDPANASDEPHTVVVAGPANLHAATVSVSFTAAQNAATFVTYSITPNL